MRARPPGLPTPNTPQGRARARKTRLLTPDTHEGRARIPEGRVGNPGSAADRLPPAGWSSVVRPVLRGPRTGEQEGRPGRAPGQEWTPVAVPAAVAEPVCVPVPDRVRPIRMAPSPEVPHDRTRGPLPGAPRHPDRSARRRSAVHPALGDTGTKTARRTGTGTDSAAAADRTTRSTRQVGPSHSRGSGQPPRPAGGVRRRPLRCSPEGRVN